MCSYLFTFKYMADHLGSGTNDLKLFAILRHYSATSHDHQKVTDIGNVGNAPQRMIHHDFLQEKRENIVELGFSEQQLSFIESKFDYVSS